MMRYNNLCSFKLFSQIINDNILKYISTRYVSTGLGLWEHDINSEIKHNIEEYWKDKLGQSNFDEKKDSNEKFYVLSMFPYPSGKLHMGHVRVYTISDSVARFYRMRGKNVMHPMGWDAFGLPAENAAMERSVDPSLWTEQNIENMKEQLNRLGCSFDWDRELSTCSPDYYKWTQDLFLKLFERGLIYRKEALVNWDPVDQTVLADEQVDKNGCSWRSGAKVEKKLLDQWFVKTTAFAKSLLDGLDDPILKEWRDIIKLQKHWIGECNGTTFEFQLVSSDSKFPKSMTVWTDKPEFIEGAKYICVSSSSLLARIEEPRDHNEASKRLNAQIVNPFTGELLPIFLTDSIEFAPFADSHVGIPSASEADAEFADSVGIEFESGSVLAHAEVEQKRKEILERAQEMNIGGYLVSSKLRDWLISRQRYWGTPIPIVHCKTCGVQPVPRDQLPVSLPKLDKLSIKGKSSLLEVTQWLETNCPKCGGHATRETDTMDTFVDSSWYFLRYIDAKNDQEMFSTDKAKQMLPVDLYIGGKEHAVLHLYYARFINHFLHSEGLVPTREPFKQLLVQGMVMGRSYRVKGSGKYLKEHEVETTGKNSFVAKETKDQVVAAWEKMSKSKYNGVDPTEMFSEYGTDTTRLLILADVAPTSHRNWSTATFPGILKWQHRLWLTIRNFIKKRNQLTPEQLSSGPIGDQFSEQEDLMFDNRNYYVKGVTFNIMDSQQLSVAISKMQGLTNSLRRALPETIKLSHQYERALAAQLIMLAPLAPHFASELWAGFCSAPHRCKNETTDNQEIQWDKNVLQQHWPQVDMEYKLELTVMVNGFDILEKKIPRYVLDEMTSEDVMQLVMQEPKFQEYIQGRRIVKVNFRSEKGCDASINYTTKRVTEQVEIEQKLC